MSKVNQNKLLHQESTTSPWLVLPFILTLTITPLIMGIYSFNPNLSGEYWYTTTTSATDLFLYYKSFYLTIMGVLMALIFIVYRFMTQRKFSFGIAMIPVYVYLGCIILSTCFSSSITHSIHGVVHHFESTFVLLTYCMLVMYAAYFIDNERNLKWFINGFIIGVAILALFGLSQVSSGLFKGLYDDGTLAYNSGFYNFMNDLFGCTDGMHWYEKLEPYKTDWMAEYLYMPTGAQPGRLSLNFPLGQVYLTLYNPNYIAYFTTLTAPLFATLAFFQDKIWKKIVFGLVALASIICLVGSKSVSGFLSLSVSVVILIIAFRKKIFKHWIPWVSTLAVVIVASIILNAVSGGFITDKVDYVKAKLERSLKQGFQNEDWSGIRNLTSTPEGIKIEYYDEVAIFTMNYDSQNGVTCEFKDEDGNILETKTSTDSNGNQVTVLTDERFSNKVKSEYKNSIRVTYAEILPGMSYLPSCNIHIDNKSWRITNQIRVSTYSYGLSGNESLPFTVMSSGTDDTIGKYYYYTDLPNTKVLELFHEIASDTTSLTACFTQLAEVSSDYTEIKNTILNSSNPQQEAINYFNQIASDEDELYYFFTCMTMSMDKDPNYYYLNQVGNWTQIGTKPDQAIFENYPRFASSRGFIWSRSIPLMFENVKTFLIGTGPDTFSHNYPHYDYVDLFRNDYGGMVITKPHSLYLQIGVQTGFVSMIALIALYVLYLISCIKLYWKSSFTTLTSKVSVGILASVTGYMISGITNDSTVTYSFVFWGLMGVGIAVNRMEKKAIQAEIEAEEKAARLEQLRLEREAKKQAAKAAKANK